VNAGDDHDGIAQDTFAETDHDRGDDRIAIALIAGLRAPTSQQAAAGKPAGARPLRRPTSPPAIRWPRPWCRR